MGNIVSSKMAPVKEAIMNNKAYSARTLLAVIFTVLLVALGSIRSRRKKSKNKTSVRGCESDSSWLPPGAAKEDFEVAEVHVFLKKKKK